MTKELNESKKFKFECDTNRITMEANYIATSQENAIEQFEKSMTELHSIEKLKYWELMNDKEEFNYGNVLTITEESIQAS
ncbi:hypothetical protein [Bacillus bombysepticus]|uniref:hypothetical protein n=1 Tax=Bacillus bombysepticus TaxID=658666 RepID=UPI00301B3EBE